MVPSTVRGAGGLDQKRKAALAVLIDVEVPVAPRAVGYFYNL